MFHAIWDYLDEIFDVGIFVALVTAALLGTQTITGTIAATLQAATATLREEVEAVIGRVAIFDELTALAALHDERVWKATLRDELVGLAGVSDE